MKLAVTQTPGKKPSANAGRKNCQRSDNNNNWNAPERLCKRTERVGNRKTS